MGNEILRRFETTKLRNKKDNEIRRTLDKIERMVFNMKITKNPVLRRMKKEDWIVTVNNKASFCWACKYTTDIIRAALLGEESTVSTDKGSHKNNSTNVSEDEK